MVSTADRVQALEVHLRGQRQTPTRSHSSPTPTASNDDSEQCRRDGYLSDDERDEDADGLTNLDEVSYSRMTPHVLEADLLQSTETAVPHRLRRHGSRPTTTPTATASATAPTTRTTTTSRTSWSSAASTPPTSGFGPRRGAAEPQESLGRDPHRQQAQGQPPRELRARQPVQPLLCRSLHVARLCPTYIPFDSPCAPYDDSIGWFALD